MIPQAVLMRSGLKTINTARSRAAVNAAKPKVIHNAVKRNRFHDVKASTCWVWRPIKPNSASITLKRYDYVDGNTKTELEDSVRLNSPEDKKDLRLLVKTEENIPSSGRGRRTREGNDERVDELNGQGNDQGIGSNRGVEGANGNVEGANGGTPNFSMIIAQQLHILLPTMLAQYFLILESGTPLFVPAFECRFNLEERLERVSAQVLDPL
ncbi:hypothetical protein Tco_0419146 [Tanacetum coccineum]